METRREGGSSGRSGAKGWAVAVVVLAAAGLGLWFSFQHREPEATAVLPSDAPGAAAGVERAKSAKSAAESAVADDGVPRLLLEVGDRLTYSVSQNQKVSLTIATDFDFAAPAGSGTPSVPAAPPVVSEPKSMETKQGMLGQLKLEVLALLEPAPEDPRLQEGWLVECSLSGMSMEMAIEGTDIPQDEEMRRQVAAAKDKLSDEAMRSRVQMEVRESGEIGKIVVSTDSPEVRNQWRGLLSRWQIVFPEDAVSTWEQEEQDDSGIYVAKYEWTSADYPRKLLKRKLRYKKLALTSPSGPAMPPEHSVEGETRVAVDAYPVSVQGWETKSVSSKGKGAFSVKGEARFSLELTSAENDPALAGRGAQALAKFLQDTNAMAWAGDAGPAGGASVPQTPEDIEKLLELLRTSVRFYGGDSPQALNIASLLIRALQSSSDPALVGVIMDALSEDYSDAGYAMVLTGVLGAAGTEPAQEGLLEIIGTADWPVELKEMSYTSLAQVTQPVPGTEDVLIRQHEEGPEAYRDTALLMLAHAGHYLEGMDEGRRAAVLDYVQGSVADVDAEAYGRNLSVALAVLGNLGPTDVPDLVARAAQSDDPWVRSEALASLTRVQTEEAVQLVIEGTKDEDETVRLSAIRTLGEQNATGGLDALRELVLKDPSENVRSLAASTLVNSYWGDDEAVAALLREVAQNDPSEQVRATAAAMGEHVGTRPWGTADEESESRPVVP